MTNRPFTELTYERRGAAGWIMLDRPTHRNALSPTMLRELLTVLDLAARDDRVRLLVITGSGGAFCTGADTGYYWRTMGVDDGLDRLVDELLEPFVEFISRLRTAPYPVIAAVHGPCSAAGLEIVRSCDIVLSDTDGQHEPVTLFGRVERLASMLGAQSRVHLRALKAATVPTVAGA